MTDPLTVERAAFVRGTLSATGFGTAICALVAALSDPRLALTITLGAAIAAANFLLLARWIARAIDRTVSVQDGRVTPLGRLESDHADEPPTPPKPVASGLRLAFLLLAMLGLLWYMPARPEGLAVGALIVLLAATTAGYRHNRAI